MTFWWACSHNIYIGFCMVSDLAKFGVKNRNFFEKKICSEMILKGFPRHLHHFFRRNSTNFTSSWANFVACMMEFSCVLAIPCSQNSSFLEKKIDPKRHPKTCKRLPASSKCCDALFLIIFYGGSHTFHSDPRMRTFHFQKCKICLIIS